MQEPQEGGFALGIVHCDRTAKQQVVVHTQYTYFVRGCCLPGCRGVKVGCQVRVYAPWNDVRSVAAGSADVC